MRRVAVTGIGLVCPLGLTPLEAFARACAGRSGVRQLSDAPFAQRLQAALGASVPQLPDTGRDPAQARMLDRFSHFAVYAAQQALAASCGALDGLAPSRGGVFLGTGMGGMLSMDKGYQTLYGEGSDRINPFTVLQGMHNAAAAWIGIDHGLHGPCLTYSSACSSSAIAIGEAWQRVASGQLDVALAGGSEAPLSLGSLKAWEAMRTVATPDPRDPATSCKPFSKNRSGMVLGEGAALLVLEPLERARSRGATLQGEVLGCGLSNEASHITRPSVQGQAAALRAALHSAGIDAGEVDAINAHGTGTLANDATETAAIREVFGARAPQLPVSATKALHGHLLGAAGALECALALLALQHGVALPTAHLDEPDPACDLDYVPHTARPGFTGRTVLSSSFAFGGSNAVLVLRAI